MQTFLARYGSEIKGVLSGFDRLRLRGTIRWLASLRGLGTFLNSHRILLKDFKDYAMGLTQQIQSATERLAERCGRPLIYLPSSSERKETRALEIAQADGVTQGLIAVFKCVETCHTFTVGPNADTKRLELRQGPGKCSHLYFYVRDPQYGPMSVRLQTWFPFTIHVCLNGREWLAQQLSRHGIGFEQRDNCFVSGADVDRAQQLFDRQLETDWDRMLDRLVKQWHPAHSKLFPQPLEYYWSADETEWATDVMFRSPEALAKVYPHFLRHAMTTFGSEDVLRFLGNRPQVKVHGNFTKEVLSSVKTRPEGTRIKHSINRNSLKMYDKQDQVLRVETTVNNPRDMKVYRAKEGESQGEKSWNRLRKGVSDLHRRAEISQQSNERYLESLAAVDVPTPLGEVIKKVCAPTVWQGKRLRALQPLSDGDGALLAAVVRGEFAVNGFRNRELRDVLEGEAPSDPVEARRQTARITRQLRLLRGHGLIRKVPRTHRYQLTDSGRTIITALLVAQQTDVKQLTQLAA
jgi:hypothetical protein